jgi:hypothetical protein|nr:MAG TPA: hypothetical protein [Bacteriophage sp.]
MFMGWLTNSWSVLFIIEREIHIMPVRNRLVYVGED